MNKIGRPRNTSGSLYSRRDSRVWWMSYRDQNGKFRQESTGERERGEAEKVLRKLLVARRRGAAAERRAGTVGSASTSGRIGSLRTAPNRPSGASRPIGTTSAR